MRSLPTPLARSRRPILSRRRRRESQCRSRSCGSTSIRLVPRWQVEYFHEGVASVSRTFSTIDDASRGFRRLYPNIPDDRLRSFVAEGLREADGGWRMKLDPATYATWEPGDLRPLLAKIPTPTLVLRGADSIVSTTEGTAALADGLPDRDVREIKGGSHMLVLEHPEEVAALIRRFITSRSH